MHQRAGGAMENRAKRQRLGNTAQGLRENLQWSKHTAQNQCQATEDEGKRVGIFSPESEQPDTEVGHEVDAQRQKRHQRPRKKAYQAELRWSYQDERHSDSDNAVEEHAHQPLSQVLREIVEDITAR